MAVILKLRVIRVFEVTRFRRHHPGVFPAKIVKELIRMVLRPRSGRRPGAE